MPRARRQRRRPRPRAGLDAGDFDHHCPACGARPGAGSSSTRTRRLDPRSSYAASKVAQEHYAAAWARQAGRAAVALRYHNVYGPGMPRDTPYSGVAAMFRSSLERGEAPRVFEDGGQMRDFVHVADVARANLAALERGRRATGRARAPTTSAPASPVAIGDVAGVAGAPAGPWRPRSPASTGSATSATSSRRRSGPRRELGFRAAVAPTDGLARVRHRAAARLTGVTSA